MSALVRRIVSPVGLSAIASVGAAPTGDAWDIYLGDIPFMLDPSPNAPFRIKAIGQTLYRYDTSNQAGEQTLGVWWLRSQTSFHGGAGQTYLDGTDPTISSEVASLRYNTSQGVDVWTPGQVSLLPDTTQLHASVTAGIQLIGALDGATPVVFYSDGANLYRNDGTTQTAVTWGGTGTILSLAQDGTNYYAADATGIYQGTLAGGNGTLIWNTGSSNVHIAWIKQRLMAAVGTSIYELTGAGPALPTPKFTASANWTWDVLADGPEAIYAAGHEGSHSVIYKFVLDANGGVPTLTTGIAAVTTPNDVVVKSLANHSDSWMAIGTDQGLYVAQFASGGDLALGLIRNSDLGAVNALTTRDRFVYANYAAADGVGTLARIDLSLEVKSGMYAWAPDLRATGNAAGAVTQLDLFGDKLVFLVSGKGIYVESTTSVAQGTLTTSRIRYDTSEAKIFDAVRWHGEAASGSIECDVAINTDTNGRNLGVLAGSGFDSFDVPILQPGGDYATLVFTLKPSATGVSPILHGWLLKALPMQSRSYQIMLPLACYDIEKLGNGKTRGHPGWSLERVDDVMKMADQQRSQVLQQIAGPKAQRRSMRVVIDDIDFQQVVPPRTSTRSGGLLYLTLRTV